MEFLYLIKEWWFLIIGFISFLALVFNLGRTMTATLSKIEYEMKDFNFHLTSLKDDRVLMLKRLESHEKEIQKLFTIVNQNDLIINQILLKERDKK